ncbi:hypothetical protein AAFF_G00288110 [Aldrovandia affinis]|uniref:Uncharacterized protein n=1 Tax=Aldrovandia affinis TaxID=143900 RepID=A0AAD7SQX9_9TELE|nr:hypothetical protein AAFF_G00288110 [Aldrovandia affinis]
MTKPRRSSTRTETARACWPQWTPPSTSPSGSASRSPASPRSSTLRRARRSTHCPTCGARTRSSSGCRIPRPPPRAVVGRQALQRQPSWNGGLPRGTEEEEARPRHVLRPLVPPLQERCPPLHNGSGSL